MIKFENYKKIEEAIDSMITLTDDEIYSNRPEIKKLFRNEYQWFEEFEKISLKLKQLKEEMIFTLEIEAEE